MSIMLGASVLGPVCLTRKSMDDRILLDFPTGSELNIEKGGLHLDYFHYIPSWLLKRNYFNNYKLP